MSWRRPVMGAAAVLSTACSETLEECAMAAAEDWDEIEISGAYAVASWIRTEEGWVWVTGLSGTPIELGYTNADTHDASVGRIRGARHDNSRSGTARAGLAGDS